ncbi:MAG: hypothetical protein ACPGYM_08580 [Flavobacteriales bacterium]
MGNSLQDHRRVWLIHGGLSNVWMGAGLCVAMDASARRTAGEAFWNWVGEGTLGLAVFMAGLGFFGSAVRHLVHMDRRRERSEH